MSEGLDAVGCEVLGSFDGEGQGGGFVVCGLLDWVWWGRMGEVGREVYRKECQSGRRVMKRGAWYGISMSRGFGWSSRHRVDGRGGTD